MTKEDKKNAYLYCKFRDEQFALYDEYAKRNGMMMKTLLVVNALFYAKEGMTQKGNLSADISIKADRPSHYQKSSGRGICDCH